MAVGPSFFVNNLNEQEVEMRSKVCCLILCLLLSLLLTACGSVVTPPGSPLTSSQSPIATQSPETDLLSLIPDPPVPEPGKASISGLLYSISGKGPIPGTLYYLTPSKEPDTPPNILVGPRDKGGDVRGTSDDQGRVVLNNIPPGSYYLVVWAPYNWVLAVESDIDMTPRVITLQANQQVNLGVVYLPWP